METKMLVIVTSGEKDKTKAMIGLNLALHSNVETKVILFGESEKLAASGDKDIDSLLEGVRNKNILPIACQNIADSANIREKLMELKIVLKPISSVITDFLGKGYIPVTF